MAPSSGMHPLGIPWAMRRCGVEASLRSASKLSGFRELFLWLAERATLWFQLLTYICIYMYRCVYLYLYICIYVCIMYIYIMYIHT